MNVSDRAIAMLGACSPACQAISSVMTSTSRHTAMLADSDSRAMNESAGAGQEYASTTMAAMIPAQLAVSTRSRPNPNRGAAMSCPGWKCATLFAVPRASVTTSRNDSQHLAVFGRERDGPVRRVQRTVRTLHESVREAGEPGQHLGPPAGPAIERH